MKSGPKKRKRSRYAKIKVGTKGSTFVSPGLVYAPYLPFTEEELIFDDLNIPENSLSAAEEKIKQEIWATKPRSPASQYEEEGSWDEAKTLEESKELISRYLEKIRKDLKELNPDDFH
jgi:hypothetical protein